MSRRPLNVFWLFLFVTVFFVNGSYAADSANEWQRVVEAAKKEGKIVAGGPPTAVLSTHVGLMPR